MAEQLDMQASCKALHATVQERKKPLEEKRSQLHGKLSALLESIAPVLAQEQEIRAQIKEINAQLFPLDMLASNIIRAKDLKEPLAGPALKTLNEQAEAL